MDPNRPLILGALLLSIAASVHAQSDSGDWPSYNRTLTGHRFSPLGEINIANASELKSGIEAAVQSTANAGVEWIATYAWLNARFGERVHMPSPNHPHAVDESIEVETGDRIPGLAEHVAKLAVVLPIVDALRVGISGQYQSGQFARGDEANLLSRVDGFMVWSSSVEWKIGSSTQLIATIHNLLDERYATFGLLGNAEDVLGEGHDDDPLFISPGAPRSVRLSVSWRM